VRSRAIDEISRLRVAVAIGTIRQQHQRAASARGLNRVERAEGRVVQRRGSPGVEAIDRRQRRGTIGRQRRGDGRVAADRDDHHLIAGPQRSHEGPGR